jgi:hypothetical protein
MASPAKDARNIARAGWRAQHLRSALRARPWQAPRPLRRRQRRPGRRSSKRPPASGGSTTSSSRTSLCAAYSRLSGSGSPGGGPPLGWLCMGASTSCANPGALARRPGHPYGLSGAHRRQRRQVAHPSRFSNSPHHDGPHRSGHEPPHVSQTGPKSPQIAGNLPACPERLNVAILQAFWS